VYSIDLLQGTGRPPRTRWWQAVVLTLAFMGLGGLGAYGVTVYQEMDQRIAGQGRLRQDYRQRIAGLADADAFLKQHTRDQMQLKGQTGELTAILSRQFQWSPVLTTVAGLVPPSVTLSDILVKRLEKKLTGQESAYEYVLVIGAVTESDHGAIESFVNALRAMQEQQPRLREVRVANQQFREIQERSCLYFVIECRFE
jgi:hypothetical protein